MEHDVIWLTGMPRSGTTWVSQIFAASPEIRVKFCPLFSYAFKNSMTLESGPESWVRFFDDVYSTPDPYMDQKHLSEAGLVPVFEEKADSPPYLLIKSNRHHHLTESIVTKVPGVKFIALVRDPCAAIRSWLNSPSEFPEHASPLNEWRTGACRKTGVGEYWGFSDWVEVTRMHLRLSERFPDRFFICRYEDFLKDAVAAAKELFIKLGLPYSQNVDTFIEASQSRHDDNTRSVFKAAGAVTDHKKLSPEIAHAIHMEIINTDLAQFLERG